MPGRGGGAVEFMESEALMHDGLITHRMSLAEVPRALDLMARGEALKVLISSEGGSAPLPTPPPGDCVGKARARTSGWE